VALAPEDDQIVPATSLSIVIPTFNRRKMLFAAIASVRRQKWEAIEIIVVDGGSTDGTQEAVGRERGIRLISEPDRGVYDALNKGIATATGDVVGLLNSDDRYEPQAFTRVAAAFAAFPNMHSVCGSAAIANGERIIRVVSRDTDKRLTPRTALIGDCIPNARFFRRPAMEKVGPFSLDYRFVADRDWLTRWHEAGLKTVAIPETVYVYGQHPDSMTFDAAGQHDLAIREELLRLAQHWRRDERTSAETRHVARMLEGRVRVALGLAAMRTGRLGEAGRWLWQEGDRASAATLFTIARSSVDWAGRRLIGQGRKRP
jgi:glycosyltransferase involved in cell wall biosynthesis